MPELSSNPAVFEHTLEGEGGLLLPRAIDFWHSSTASFAFSGSKFFQATFDNLMGRKLSVISFEYPPFTTSGPTPNGQTPVYDGIEVGGNCGFVFR